MGSLHNCCHNDKRHLRLCKRCIYIILTNLMNTLSTCWNTWYGSKDTRYNTLVRTATMPCNFWTFRTSPPGASYVPYKGANTQTALEKVKAKILQRGGRQGFRGLVKSFRIIDDDGSKTLSRRELKEGMELYGVPLTTAELDVIFKEFDRNGDSTVSITEFLREIRGGMNLRREDLVKDAFKCIDKDGSGICTFAELKEKTR